MSSATGNAFLYSIIIIFIGAFCLLLVGSAAYSKAFKIKNTIIDMITENREDNPNDPNINVIRDVDRYLAGIGYQAGNNCPNDVDIGTRYFSNEPNPDELTITPVTTGTYDYCVYRISYGTNYYYKVITYMSMEFPLVNRIRIPVSGDTRTFGGI